MQGQRRGVHLEERNQFRHFATCLSRGLP
jgi:hypothetical protein